MWGLDFGGRGISKADEEEDGYDEVGLTGS